MTLLVVQVASSLADVSQKVNPITGFNTAPSQALIDSNTTPSCAWMMGANFVNVTIPATATVDDAVLALWANGATSNSGSVSINAEMSSDAVSWTGGSTVVMARTRGDVAQTLWTFSGAGSTWNDTPDIAAHLQGVLDSGGFVDGNAMNLFTEGNDSVSHTTRFRTFETNSTQGFRLTVNYTAAAPGGAPPRHFFSLMGVGR